ncbi:ERMES complex subunit mmm1 [Apiotrichum porosum]|uniref:Maintenance of mitochondrial morphology protein 1 n=1 Tax=Apiotrichum porosum TaxID=105984 RepID=A0A427Y161_9TREE|nr:ERMES complex subunit mmm1 [Apiotrichum porosum]RSH84858.1 ERMES complex subunit mmm1 [Apiotrichum porosum]
MSTFLISATATPAAWTFTQGFLVGQGAFILLCLLFVRYVVFSPADAQDPDAWRQRREERSKKALLSTTAVPPLPTGHLLGTAGYDMSTHPAESADWVNVLFAQVLQGYRNDLLSTAGEEGARKHFERWLNPPSRTLSWLDPIEVTALNLGKSFPLLSNARIRPADGQGRVRAEVDLDWADTVSLSISTSVLINFPRPRFAVLPVQIGVELVAVGGTLSIQIHDPKEQRQHMHVCLLPDFHLNLKTTSLLGSRAKLQDIPKIEQLLVARLRAAIQDRFVYPHHMTFALPRLISPPMTPESVIPDSQDVRDAAASALSEGMHNLRHDLAERVAALGPTDSASILDSLDNSVNTPDSDTTLPDVADPESEGELEPQPVMPRQVPQSGIISAVATQYTASRPGGVYW